MKQPFKVADDSINTLFTLLFNNAEDKVKTILDNATDTQITSILKEKEILLNKTIDNLYLCTKYKGVLYKMALSGTSGYYVPDYNNGESRSNNVEYPAETQHLKVIFAKNNSAGAGEIQIKLQDNNWLPIALYWNEYPGNVFFIGSEIIPKGYQYKFIGLSYINIYPMIPG